MYISEWKTEFHLLILGMDFVKLIKDKEMDLSININRIQIKMGEENKFMQTFAIAHELFSKFKILIQDI
jgi:4-hydroxybenzoate polyprenyltransferase